MGSLSKSSFVMEHNIPVPEWYLLQPILDEYLNDYPTIHILLRDDSGFATSDLYKQCEENGTSCVIRLKENAILCEKASHLVDELDEIARNNKVDYAVVYGEIMYKADSWPYERRMVSNRGDMELTHK